LGLLGKRLVYLLKQINERLLEYVFALNLERKCHRAAPAPHRGAHAATECAARLSIRRSSRVIYRDYTGGAVRVLQKPCARVILENLRVANVTT